MARSKKSEDQNATATATIEATEIHVALPFVELDEELSAGFEAREAAGGNVALRTRSRAHVNVHLGKKATQSLLRLREGLRVSGARMPDGKPVWTTADALRYLLEAIADAAE